MAHVETDTGGRRKNLDVNVVPFIDLMSVLITFLLITAVWSQVSMIQLGSSIYGKKNPNMPKPKLPQQVEVVVKLDVTAGGYELTLGKDIFKIPITSIGEYNDIDLASRLEEFKAAGHEDKKDIMVFISDDLPYDRLIHTMDLLLHNNFPLISVASGGPK